MKDAAEILKNYGALMTDVDGKTAAVYKSAPEIPCKNKCFDCCKQLFPISFAEAYYISEGFKTLPRSVRRDRAAAAQKIHEKIQAENPLQFERHGVNEKTALQTHDAFARFLHGIKSDCPALDAGNPGGSCTVYPFRNHDCRTMGASFDVGARTIVGCFRFEGLRHLVPKLMNFNYRYEEKRALDKELIDAVTGSAFTSNIVYLTTMCTPLLKDFAATDWIHFFAGKNIPHREALENHFVVIDL